MHKVSDLKLGTQRIIMHESVHGLFETRCLHMWPSHTHVPRFVHQQSQLLIPGTYPPLLLQLAAVGRCHTLHEKEEDTFRYIISVCEKMCTTLHFWRDVLLWPLIKMVVIDQSRGGCHHQIVLGETFAKAFEEGVFQAGRKLWRPDDRDLQMVRVSFQLLYYLPL